MISTREMVDQLNQEIKIKRIQIRNIQNACDHKNRTVNFADSRATEYYCKDCDLYFWDDDKPV